MTKVTKQDLRNKIVKLLRNQKEEYRLKKSLVILNKLFSMHEFRTAQTILFYASFNGEVDTFEMINRAKALGKKIGLPRIQKDTRELTPFGITNTTSDLEEGLYGIKEPTGGYHNALLLDEIDMVIVPGIAFDRRHNRLGRGKGYYDRFLRTISSSVPTVGLAFDFQIVARIPQLDKHDVPVTHVIVN